MTGRIIRPRLSGIQGGKASSRFIGAEALDVSWTLGDASQLRILVNFADARVDGVCQPKGHVLYEAPAAPVIDNRQTMAARSILCLLNDDAS